MRFLAASHKRFTTKQQTCSFYRLCPGGGRLFAQKGSCLFICEKYLKAAYVLYLNTNNAVNFTFLMPSPPC
jgi:hypothetical protein